MHTLQIYFTVSPAIYRSVWEYECYYFCEESCIIKTIIFRCWIEKLPPHNCSRVDCIMPPSPNFSPSLCQWSFPFWLDILQYNLLWPTEQARSDRMPVPSIGLRGLGYFQLDFGALPPPWENISQLAHWSKEAGGMWGRTPAKVSGSQPTPSHASDTWEKMHEFWGGLLCRILW